ncbi:hypothetical protein [Bradyrhizobium australafricanum]|uniref:hypothetical protein n=1 Tax=Bradyrhizobium australafricanum TaxID=2821406 RepID=UPI001CE2C1B9|nr:hypothetical protein [Bradyrhizobium australafricanum]MCA6102784.1 hypothetical protein [Bradyrhizobium australafricanum]
MAVLISAAQFAWSRFDKGRDRKVVEQASLPRMSLYWNPQIDKDGWYRLVLTIQDIDQGFLLDRARLINPSGSVIASWKDGKPDSQRAAEIDLKWRFLPRNPAALLHIAGGSSREALLFQTNA